MDKILNISVDDGMLLTYDDRDKVLKCKKGYIKIEYDPTPDNPRDYNESNHFYFDYCIRHFL